jgi:hypothetical protein
MLAGLALALSRTEPPDRNKVDLLPAKNARAIDEVVKRAAFIAQKAGRPSPCPDDLKAAICMEFPGMKFDGARPNAEPETASVQSQSSSAPPLQRHRNATAPTLQSRGRETVPADFANLAADG